MFRDRYSLQHRKEISNIIAREHSDRVPVILEKRGNAGLNFRSSRLLVPQSHTMGSLILLIRKNFIVEVDSNQAIFIFIMSKGNAGALIAVPQNETLGLVHDRHKSPDGFMYAVVDQENCFG